LAALAAAVLYFELLAVHGEPTPTSTVPEQPRDPFGPS
jgi:hypothetical protein